MQFSPTDVRVTIQNKNSIYVNGSFSLSITRPISCGVPQGSIIGPLVFMYINDLPKCLNEGLPRMYGDDTNISLQKNNPTELENLSYECKIT